MEEIDVSARKFSHKSKSIFKLSHLFIHGVFTQ